MRVFLQCLMFTIGSSLQLGNNIHNQHESHATQLGIQTSVTLNLRTCNYGSQYLKCENMAEWIRLELIPCNVQMISVKHNNITSLEPHIMQKFNKLKFLDISANKVSTLRGSLARNRKLVWFLCDDNLIGTDGRHNAQLEAVFLRNLKLQVASFRRNKIFKLSRRMVHKWNQLAKLNLAENQIERVYSRTFALMRQLQQLDLHGNNIFYVHKKAFIHNRKLQFLDLAGNLISFTGRNRPLDLRNNPELVDLLINNNKLHSISEINLSQCKELEHLDLSLNRIQSVGRNDLGMKEHLVVLNISFNRIQQIDPGSFTTFLNLHTLDLSRNQLDSIHQDTFRNLRNLQVLSLAFNQLRSISERTFIQNGRLVALDLKSNLLSHWQPATIHSNINMRFLDLSDNSFEVGQDYFANKGTKMEIGDWASEFHEAEGEDDVTRYAHYNLNKRVFSRLQCLLMSNNRLAVQAINAHITYGVQFYNGKALCEVYEGGLDHVFKCGCTGAQLNYTITKWMK